MNDVTNACTEAAPGPAPQALDPRAEATDAALEAALRAMTRGRDLKPELATRRAAGRNIFTRQLLAFQAGVDRGTLSLNPARHADLLRRMGEAKNAYEGDDPAKAAQMQKAYNWRRRAQAAVSVSAGLMVELWAMKAKAASDPQPADVDGNPARLRGRRSERGRGRVPTQARR